MALTRLQLSYEKHNRLQKLLATDNLSPLTRDLLGNSPFVYININTKESNISLLSFLTKIKY